MSLTDLDGFPTHLCSVLSTTTEIYFTYFLLSRCDFITLKISFNLKRCSLYFLLTDGEISDVGLFLEYSNLDSKPQPSWPLCFQTVKVN